MEKYSAQCRLILTCNTLTKIISPIRSRCLALRIPPPSDLEIKDILRQIAQKENKNLEEKMVNQLVEKHGRNIRRIINSYQISKLI